MNTSDVHSQRTTSYLTPKTCRKNGTHKIEFLDTGLENLSKLLLESRFIVFLFESSFIMSSSLVFTISQYLFKIRI